MKQDVALLQNAYSKIITDYLTGDNKSKILAILPSMEVFSGNERGGDVGSRELDIASKMKSLRTLLPDGADVMTLDDVAAGAYRDYIDNNEGACMSLFLNMLAGISKATSSMYKETKYHKELLDVFEYLPPESKIWMLLPVGYLFYASHQELRDYLVSMGNVRVIITHDHSCDVFGIAVHKSFRVASVLYTKTGSAEAETVFMSVPDPSEWGEGQVDYHREYRNLLHSKKTQTKYGFRIHEPLYGRSWYCGEYNPKTKGLVKGLSDYGAVVLIGDIYRPVKTLDKMMSACQSADVETELRVLTAKNLRNDGIIAYESRRGVVPSDPDMLVMVNDICIRRLGRPDDNVVCWVVADIEGAVYADNTLIVLRTRNDARCEDIALLSMYMRSSAFRELLWRRGGSVAINTRTLLESEMPLLSEEMKKAYNGLLKVQNAYGTWCAKIQDALQRTFDADEIRMRNNAVKNLWYEEEKKIRAIEQLSELSYRIGATYPYPIAYRWRIAEASKADLSGYYALLETAEVVVTYMYIIAMMYSDMYGVVLSKKHEISDLIARKDRGLTMGMCMSLLEEVGSKGVSKSEESQQPLSEILTAFRNRYVWDALGRITNARNDMSHTRSPKGSQVAVAHENIQGDLVTLLSSMDFIADYSLRYVESTMRDSKKGVTRYQYREYMGDRQHVPLLSDSTVSPEIEQGSIYLYDRVSGMHLVRPYIIGRECPECGMWGMFYLEKVNIKTKEVVLKSFENGHTVRDADLWDVYHDVGLIM